MITDKNNRQIECGDLLMIEFGYDDDVEKLLGVAVLVDDELYFQRNNNRLENTIVNLKGKNSSRITIVRPTKIENYDNPPNIKNILDRYEDLH